MRRMPVRLRQKNDCRWSIVYSLWLIGFCVCFIAEADAAPCYGTKMPEQKQFFAGLQNYTIFKRYLEHEAGEARSTQHFFQLSYGVFDWLSIDLKSGLGNIKQNPPGRSEVDYPSNFAGGYGFRVKIVDKENIEAVFGFQHISVHPKSIHVGDDKNQAVLDDWQVSLLASYDFNSVIPYIGTRWSRVDYIHWNVGSRKRTMSDLTRSVGLIAGVHIILTDRAWIDLEGQFIDSEALAASINIGF